MTAVAENRVAVIVVADFPGNYATADDFVRHFFPGCEITGESRIPGRPTRLLVAHSSFPVSVGDPPVHYLEANGYMANSIASPRRTAAMPADATPQARAMQRAMRALSSGRYLQACWYVDEAGQLQFTFDMANFPHGDFTTVIADLSRDVAKEARKGMAPNAKHDQANAVGDVGAAVPVLRPAD